MTVGERIKKTRLKKSMTQKELADKCGIDSANLRKYEAGKQNPKLGTIEKIAEALGVHEAELLYGPEENPLAAFTEILKAADQPLNGITEGLKNMQEVYKAIAESEISVRTLLLEKYDKLNELGQELACDYIEYLSSKEAFTKKPSEE